MTSSPKCLDFLPVTTVAMRVRTLTTIMKSIGAQTRTSVVGFPTECPKVSWLTCPDCGRLFRSEQCFEQHKQTRGDARSVCQSLIRCTKCQQSVPRCKQLPEKHRCGLIKCWICSKNVQLEGHRCYIQPKTKKKT